MNYLAHLAQRALNSPLFVTAEKAAIVMNVLSGRIRIDASDLSRQAADMSRFVGDSVERDAVGRPTARLPYRRTAAGVGILTIDGILINRGAWVGSYSGETSYEGIKHQLAAAVSDPKVTSIILDMNTPGGEAVGCMECADAVRAAAKKKTVIAVVNGMACSAGYAIASGATRIVTTPTGMSGSIGVVWLHTDHSEQLAQEGIKPTLIFAGARKVDGNPFEQLSADARTRIDVEIGTFYELFCQGVAQGRGTRLSASAAKRTEAQTYIGEAAVKAGLADSIGSFETVLAELSNSQSRTKSLTSKGGSMSAESENITDNAEMQTAIKTTRAEGHSEGLKAGAAAANERVKTILSLDEAKGREAQAQAIAFNTDMSAEAAKAVLAAGPAAKANMSIADRVAETGVNSLGPMISPAGQTSKPENKINRSEIFGRLNG